MSYRKAHVQYLTLIGSTGKKERNNGQQHKDADESCNYPCDKMQSLTFEQVEP